MKETHFAFDLDGTITKQEMLPLIALHLGLMEEMRLLTKLTIEGAIGFVESFRLRCAILQSIPISTVQEIVAEVEIDPEIDAFITENRGRVSIITGNLDLWIRPLLDRLKCRFYCSTGLAAENRLVRLENVLHKSAAVHHMRGYAERIVGIGDGANDVPMFEVADLGVAFGGVHFPAPKLVEISDYMVFDGETLCRLLRTL